MTNNFMNRYITNYTNNNITNHKQIKKAEKYTTTKNDTIYGWAIQRRRQNGRFCSK